MNKDKVIDIFRELIGDKVDNFSGSLYPAFANSKITEALIKDYPDLSDQEIESLRKDLGTF